MKSFSKVAIIYAGPVKGLRPYLLSLMYANVVAFSDMKKPPVQRRLSGECKVLTFSIPKRKS